MRRKEIKLVIRLFILLYQIETILTSQGFLARLNVTVRTVCGRIIYDENLSTNYAVRS